MFNIITVDDEKMIKRSLRALIERAGTTYSVIGEATNGREALELIHYHPPHLLITDICMPEMDGLELIAEVKQRYQQMEIIVISGYGEFSYAQQALRHNVTDYLLKPIHPDEFLSTLQRIYERHERDAQRLAGRSQQMWSFLAHTEQIIQSIWTVREKGLHEELEQFRLKVEASGMDAVLAKQIYVDQLVYISQKVSEMSGLSFKPASAMEPEQHHSLEKLYEKFQTACLGMLTEVIQLRNLGQSVQIRKAIRYINANFQNSDLSLVSAAESVSMSVTYFCRFFKEETGMSFMKYVTRLRMEKAKQLLTNPENRINSVAERIGYSDYHHFAKAFKKNTGMTPSEFRNTHVFMDI